MAKHIFRPVHEAPNETEAHALKGYLEENGLHPVIRSLRPDFKGGNISGEKIPPRHLLPQEIHVPKEQMKQARILIYAYQRHHKKV